MKRVFPIFLIIFLLFPAISPSQPKCPPEGDGGDSILNRLKNRTGVPASYEELGVNHFVGEFSYLFTPLFRDDFSEDQKQYVNKNEKRGIALVGYILAVRQSPPDSTNCHSKTRRDIHIYIGEYPPKSEQDAETMMTHAVKVELTPNGQDLHPSWKRQVLEQLVKPVAKVRVSGWPLYDSLDRKLLGKTRGTLWEIDPVTKIEMWDGERWRAL
jgi:hypothetical protein